MWVTRHHSVKATAGMRLVERSKFTSSKSAVNSYLKKPENCPVKFMAAETLGGEEEAVFVYGISSGIASMCLSSAGPSCLPAPGAAPIPGVAGMGLLAPVPLLSPVPGAAAMPGPIGMPHVLAAAAPAAIEPPRCPLQHGWPRGTQKLRWW